MSVDIANPWGLRIPAFPDILEDHLASIKPTKSPVVPLSDSTGSSQIISLASAWLRRCAQKDKRSCGYNDKTDPLLPSRVIEIGDESTAEVAVREYSNTRGRYMCLSYCWGSAEFIQSTKDTIQSHTKGIPLQSLPQVFRDFIKIARALKVKYVWIDSLCILQDSEEDWQREAGRMAKIYRNSYLTIAAAGASSPYDGLFVARTRFTVGSVQCHVVDHSPIGTATNVNSPKFPLLQRGWTFQERLLSPRVLFFGPGEVSWECRRSQNCECGTKLPTFGNDFARLCHKAEAGGAGRKALWRGVVAEYSSLGLTKLSDKLPALSGLADEVILASGQEYIAGMWKESLASDLLWRRSWVMVKPSNGGAFTQRDMNRGEWRAPSWSWASIDGPVKWSSRGAGDISKFCQILAAECVLAGESRTGKILSGYLRLRCKKLVGSMVRGLSRASLIEKDRTLKTWVLKIQNIEVEIEPDGDEIPVAGTQFWIVRISSEHFLVLQADESSEGLFRRVGMSNGGQSLKWPEEMIEITII